MWETNVSAPLRAANLIVPELVLLHSPYRFVIQPLVDYVLDVERQNDDRQVAVLVPELVVSHWYQNLLHNQRANVLSSCCWCAAISGSGRSIFPGIWTRTRRQSPRQQRQSKRQATVVPLSPKLR